MFIDGSDCARTGVLGSAGSVYSLGRTGSCARQTVNTSGNSNDAVSAGGAQGTNAETVPSNVYSVGLKGFMGKHDKTGYAADSYLRAQFYFRTSALPDVEVEIGKLSILGQYVSSNAVDVVRLYLKSNGACYVRSTNGSRNSADTGAIRVGDWNRIEVGMVITSGGDRTVTLNVNEYSLVSTYATSAECIGGATSITSFFIYGGSVHSPGSWSGTQTLDFDDFVVWDDADSPSGNGAMKGARIVHLFPTSDVSIGAWTGGDGGTTNLYQALDNYPPTGISGGTDLQQIENATKNAGSSPYIGSFGTLANALPSGLSYKSLLGVSGGVWHGEDINTGTKTGAVTLNAPSEFSSSNVNTSFAYGDDFGAVTSWSIGSATTSPFIHKRVQRSDSPSLPSLTADIRMAVTKDDSSTRMGIICGMSMTIAFLATESQPPYNAYHRAIAPLLVR